MPQPGSSDLFTYTRKEIRAVLRDDITLGAVLAPTQTPLDVGTVLGMVTASNQFIPYKSSNTDGSQLAKVILAESVDPSTLPQTVKVYAEGIFYKDRLIGLDTGAITNLNAREPVPNILIVS